MSDDTVNAAYTQVDADGSPSMKYVPIIVSEPTYVTGSRMILFFLFTLFTAVLLYTYMSRPACKNCKPDEKSGFMEHMGGGADADMPRKARYIEYKGRDPSVMIKHDGYEKLYRAKKIADNHWEIDLGRERNIESFEAYKLPSNTAVEEIRYMDKLHREVL